LHHIKGNSTRHQPKSHVVNAVQDLLSRDWDTKLKHVHQECNRLTDCLAKATERMGISAHCWSQPSDFALNALHEDINGLSITKLISK
ncbi:hypothetical protein J1N35_026721, partial [Gossypium stocksii]